MKNETEFAQELKKNVMKWIRDAKRNGTTGASVDCLKQCVRTPSTSLDGAPRGTNAMYYYSQLFREVCESPEIKSFIIIA